MKKLLNLQSSFPSIDTSWKDKKWGNIDWNSQNCDKSLKNFSSNSINFYCFKSKRNHFCLKKTMIQGKEVAYIQIAKLSPTAQKLYQIPYIFCPLCDLFSFIPLIATYWHQEEPLGCSEFAEPNYSFKQYIYIVAYFGIMLEVYWHVAEGNLE